MRGVRVGLFRKHQNYWSATTATENADYLEVLDKIDAVF